MKEFVFICILFCGVSGFTETSAESIFNPFAPASGVVHTEKDGLDNVREANEISKKLFGKKRERRYKESRTMTTVFNPDKSGEDLYDITSNGIFKNVLNKKRERRFTEKRIPNEDFDLEKDDDVSHTVKDLDSIGKIKFDMKRERRFAQLAGSLANASSDPAKLLESAKQVLNIVDEFNKIRQNNFGKSRDRRAADDSSGVNKVTDMIKDVLGIVDSWDGKIRKWEKQRNRRAADNNSSGVNKVTDMIKDVLGIVDSWDGKIRDWGKQRSRRFTEIRVTSELLAASTASKVADEAKKLLDIVKEFKKNGNTSDRKRERRFSESSSSTDYDIDSAVKEAAAGFEAILKTYLHQPIATGNFQESTMREYSLLKTPEGKSVFGTLDGDLNLSFRFIWKYRQPRTGDIVSCRIPSNKTAEHYMMVLGKRIIEVNVDGGELTHKGVVLVSPWKNSSYIESMECLLHKNRLVSRAQEIDDKNKNDKESKYILTQILERINCTVTGENTENIRYDFITCNCHDLVLFWAYGYVESDCIRTVFHRCSKYRTGTVAKIASYIDRNRPVSSSSLNYETLH